MFLILLGILHNLQKKHKTKEAENSVTATPTQFTKAL